ncbi:hypothetical protein HYDPIDRAFT_169884 [Hydnomerulius pinastri MD-312]|uniref:F-box domain-containing protein n=1 Tax=Hydnomerulius pinastri MD-312 TaxID=994086 RepID=A0A0C9WBE7_9AGAM|nr:hypothetical protein HYDPIDRAFT_169884 [Hydnomerulius pinastri MD-312]
MSPLASSFAELVGFIQAASIRVDKLGSALRSKPTVSVKVLSERQLEKLCVATTIIPKKENMASPDCNLSAKDTVAMSHLPPELIFAILESAYYSPSGSPDYTFLASCSLVCNSWSAPAQSLLFRSTTKLRSYSIPKFHAAVMSSSVRGKPLGTAVRSLEISVGRSMNESCHPLDFARLLQACPRLYELALSTYGLHEFDQAALAELKKTGSGIKALNLQYCGVQSPVLFQLLEIWPGIQFLKVGTEIAAWPWRNPAEIPVLRQPNSGGGPGNTLDTTERPGASVSLYDLVLSRIPQPAVLTWLLTSSSASLRILDLREVPGPATRTILGLHAKRLRSLRLLHYSFDSAAFLRQCTELEELVLFHVPTMVPLAPALPPSIEHLSFRNPIHTYRNTLRPFLDAIEVLPKLRVLTCDRNSEQLEEFAILKARCVERGVEVEISDVPFWVYYSTRADTTSREMRAAIPSQGCLCTRWLLAWLLAGVALPPSYGTRRERDRGPLRNV